MPYKISRRDFIALASAGLAASRVVGQSGGRVRRTFAYVGSWTQGRFGVGGGGGISVFDVNPDGSLTFLSKLGQEFEDMNAGFLAISADGRFLYSTEEVGDLHQEVGAGGGVFSFAINQADGSLTFLNAQPSMGVSPAYIVIDRTGEFLLAANHGSYFASTRVVDNNGIPEIEKVFDDSTVAVLPLNSDGTIAPATDVAILDRVSGVPGILEQMSPHAHSISFDLTGERIVVADKGTDRLYSYRFNRKTKSLEDAKHIQTELAVSPRHSVFHPRRPFVYVSYEHVPQTAAFHFDSNTGVLRHLQTISTVPAGYSGGGRPSDIKLHPNGNFVYTANRVHDSIAIHAIDESTGRMELVEIVGSGGIGPRGITFDPTGNYLHVANQQSNQIATFVVDPQSGRITSTGATADVLMPSCIKFLQI